MTFRIEEKEAFAVFGMEKQLEEGENAAAFWTECYQAGLYHKLFYDAGGVGDPDKEPPGVGLVNAAGGYEVAEGGLVYMICAFVREGCRTEGYKVLQVPKSIWAVFRGKEAGDPGKQIPKLFQHAYKKWLPSSGYARAPSPDMEIYSVTESGKYCDEVWVPIQKK